MSVNRITTTHNKIQVAGGMSVPRYLGMPVERFPEYVAFLRILIKLNKDEDGAPSPELKQALKVRGGRGWNKVYLLGLVGAFD